MNCEHCNNEMKWVGDLMTGSMCCPHCSCLEVPPRGFIAQEVEDMGFGSDFHERTGMWLDCGSWRAKCSCCDCEFETGYGPEDVKGDDPQHYCGGSPRCCP